MNLKLDVRRSEPWGILHKPVTSAGGLGAIKRQAENFQHKLKSLTEAPVSSMSIGSALAKFTFSMEAAKSQAHSFHSPHLEMRGESVPIRPMFLEASWGAILKVQREAGRIRASL